MGRFKIVQYSFIGIAYFFILYIMWTFIESSGDYTTWLTGGKVFMMFAWSVFMGITIGINRNWFKD